MIRQVLIFLFVVAQHFLSFKPGIFECTDKGAYYKLELNGDSTYHFYFPPLIPAVVKGQSLDSENGILSIESGFWNCINDTILLFDTVSRVYDKTSVSEEYSNNQNYILVRVVDEKNNPLSGIEVSLNSDKHIKMTDVSGYVKFEFKEIKRIKHYESDSSTAFCPTGMHCDSANMETCCSGLKKRNRQMDSWIEELSVGCCEGPGVFSMIVNGHANYFKVVIDHNPITKREIRIRKLIVQDDAIIIEQASGFSNRQSVTLNRKN